MLNTLDLLTHQMYQKEMLLRADKERLVRTALSGKGQPAALRRLLIRWHGLFTRMQATLNRRQRRLKTFTRLYLQQDKRRSSRIWGIGQGALWTTERQRDFVCNRRATAQVQRSSSGWMRMGQGD